MGERSYVTITVPEGHEAWLVAVAAQWDDRCYMHGTEAVFEQASWGTEDEGVQASIAWLAEHLVEFDVSDGGVAGMWGDTTDRYRLVDGAVSCVATTLVHDSAGGVVSTADIERVLADFDPNDPARGLIAELRALYGVPAFTEGHAPKSLPEPEQIEVSA